MKTFLEYETRYSLKKSSKMLAFHIKAQNPASPHLYGTDIVCIVHNVADVFYSRYETYLIPGETVMGRGEAFPPGIGYALCLFYSRGRQFRYCVEWSSREENCWFHRIGSKLASHFAHNVNTIHAMSQTLCGRRFPSPSLPQE